MPMPTARKRKPRRGRVRVRTIWAAGIVIGCPLVYLGGGTVYRNMFHAVGVNEGSAAAPARLRVASKTAASTASAGMGKDDKAEEQEQDAPVQTCVAHRDCARGSVPGGFCSADTNACTSSP